jgi:hypothetical protein
VHVIRVRKTIRTARGCALLTILAAARPVIGAEELRLPGWVMTPAEDGMCVVHVDSTLPGCYNVYCGAAEDAPQGSIWSTCVSNCMITQTFGTWIVPGAPCLVERLAVPSGILPEDARAAIAAVKHELGPGERVAAVALATARRIRDWKFGGPYKLRDVLVVRVATDSTDTTRELRVNWSGGRWCSAQGN